MDPMAPTLTLPSAARNLIRAIPVCLLLALPAAAVAQEGQAAGSFDPGSRLVTRAELERLLEDTQAIVTSPAYSEEVQNQARAYVSLLEQRLARGDFRAGDRIILTIDVQTITPDTFTVEPGPSVILLKAM